MNKLNQLTALRFFAAFAVVIGHAGDYKPFSMYAVNFFNKSHAVSFFFVLSGFILSFVYKRFSSPADCWDFFTARVSRIFPVHAFTLFICIIAFWPDIYSAGSGNLDTMFISNIFMIQSWIPDIKYYFSFNGVSWSISTEIGFYMLFPLMIYLIKRFGAISFVIPAIASACMIYLTIQWQLPIVGVNVIDATGMIYINPLCRFFEFSLGIAACMVYEKITTSDIKVLRTSTVSILSLVMIFASSSLVYYVGRIFQTSPQWPVSIYMFQNGMGIFFAVTICLVAACNGWIARALGNKFFVWLGEISFSLYMVHQLVIRFIVKYFQHEITINAGFVFSMYIIASLILSAMVYHLIECPARKELKEFFSSIKLKFCSFVHHA
ncbi:acyltransferase [Phytobacter diazotrophicus]|uniref:acyltransferase family protein n=1 Tax=Phytobacter diazotrophicus TaxID=395631 RepID=UPI002FF8ED82